MNIHIVSSMRHFNEDLPFVETIIATIKDEGHGLALNWFGAAKARRQENTVTALNLDWGEQVQQNIDAISEADAVIVEGSRFNYSQGYQTAIALQQNKPVLNLYRSNLTEYKEWPDKVFVSGVNHPKFISKAYRTTEELEKIVRKFLENATPKNQEIDLKFALSVQTVNLLDRLAVQQGTSRNSIVKQILEKHSANKP